MEINSTQNTRMIHCRVYLRPIMIGILVLSCFNCAPIQVKVDYNRDVLFDKYTSYAWIDNAQSDIVENNFEKAVLDKLVMHAANEEFSNKGYSVANDSADFLVSYFLVVNTKTDVYVVENYYSNIGYPAAQVTSNTQDYQKLRQNTYETGILILDIVDRKTNERIWRGYAQSRFGASSGVDKPEQQIVTALRKILRHFPP